MTRRFRRCAHKSQRLTRDRTHSHLDACAIGRIFLADTDVSDAQNAYLRPRARPPNAIASGDLSLSLSSAKPYAGADHSVFRHQPETCCIRTTFLDSAIFVI